MPSGRPWTATITVLATLVVAAAVVQSTLASTAAAPSEARLVVRFRPDAGVSARTALLTSVAGETAGRLPAQTAVVEVDARVAARAEQALDASPLTLYAEPERRARVLTLPDDPLLRDANAWGLGRVGALVAWERTHGTPSVVVAVLDTGVRAHEELAGAIAPGGIDLVAPDADPNDENGHGTAVAGVVAGRAGNRAGAAGVCPACRILPIRVAGADGTGTSVTLAQGIDAAVAAGVEVITISLGLDAPAQVVTDAVDRALAAGIVVVAAAGNGGGTSPVYPAALPGVIGVTASGRADELLPWSQRGSWVAVAAPGTAVTPLLSGRYGPRTGTSVAAAHVSGAVGLALTLAPGTAPAAMRAAVLASAAPTVPANATASGRLDVPALLGALAPGGASPVALVTPVVTGTPTSGFRLYRSSASFRNATTVTQQWQRCTAPGVGCVSIAGETGPTHVLTADDVGLRLSVRATGANPYGAVTVTSASTLPVAALPVPSAITPPTVQGTAMVGATLRSSLGTWGGVGGTATFAITWQRCDGSGGSCVTIAGKTGPVIVLADADAASRIRSVVTVTSGAERGVATSVPTAVVAQVGAPELRGRPPVIGGASVEGSVVTVSAAQFEYAQRPPTIEWLRCAADGSACTAIPGAPATSSYRLAAADVGSTVRVRLTAVGAGGTTTATTDAFGPVLRAAPTAVRPPTISGDPIVGRTVTAVAPVAVGAAAVTYRWQQCEAPPVCTDVPGATGATYVVAAEDAGRFLRVVATLAGAVGAPDVTSPSPPSTRVQPASLPGTLSVTLFGTVAVGQPLALRFPPLPGAGLVYGWQRCAVTCAVIAGQIGISYTPTSADVGLAIVGTVTATIWSGPVTYASAPSVAVP